MTTPPNPDIDPVSRTMNPEPKLQVGAANLVLDDVRAGKHHA